MTRSPAAILLLLAMTTAVMAAECPRVVRIDVLDRQHRLLRQGNAVLLGGRDDALTVAHVVDEGVYVRWFLPNGRQRLTSVVIDDPHGGDGLTRIAAPRIRGAPRPTTAIPGAGARVRLLGVLPQTGPIALRGTTGRAARHPLLRGARELFIPLSDGLSGAAIVDTSCRLIGLAAFGWWTGAGQRSWYLPISTEH